MHTADPKAAFAFYASQFNWTKGDAVDMGPTGTYQIVKAGDVQIGGMVRTQQGQTSAWLYYFGTKDVHRALSGIVDAGGTVLHGPTEVPGGALIIHGRDPQGAMFALVGPAAGPA